MTVIDVVPGKAPKTAFCDEKGCFSTVKPGTLKCFSHNPKATDAEQEAEAQRRQDYFAARAWEQERRKLARLTDQVLKENADFHKRFGRFLA